MTPIDIQYAFGLERKAIKTYIYEKLIANGYVTKKSDRWFKPTEKLLNLAFLPTKYIMNESQRRYLQVQTACTKEDIINLFDGNVQIFKELIKIGYFKFDSDRRYRKSEPFEEMLAEGEDTFYFRKDEE
jgi:hypothetical protein